MTAPSAKLTEIDAPFDAFAAAAGRAGGGCWAGLRRDHFGCERAGARGKHTLVKNGPDRDWALD